MLRDSFTLVYRYLKLLLDLALFYCNDKDVNNDVNRNKEIRIEMVACHVDDFIYAGLVVSRRNNMLVGLG